MKAAPGDEAGQRAAALGADFTPAHSSGEKTLAEPAVVTCPK
jgi:hypothetical protein